MPRARTSPTWLFEPYFELGRVEVPLWSGVERRRPINAFDTQPSPRRSDRGRVARRRLVPTTSPNTTHREARVELVRATIELVNRDLGATIGG